MTNGITQIEGTEAGHQRRFGLALAAALFALRLFGAYPKRAMTRG